MMTQFWIGYASGAASAVCMSLVITIGLVFVIHKWPPRG